MNANDVLAYVEAHPVPIGLAVGGVAIGVLVARRTAAKPAGTTNTSSSPQASGATVTVGDAQNSLAGLQGPQGPAGPPGPVGPAGPVSSPQVPSPPPAPKPTPTPTPKVPTSKTITSADKKKFSCKGSDFLTYGRGSDANNIVCRSASSGKDYPVTVVKK